MGPDQLATQGVPATARALAEVLALAMGLDAGASSTRFEFEVNRSGELVQLWKHTDLVEMLKHERFGPRAVESADRLGAAEIAEQLRERTERYSRNSG